MSLIDKVYSEFDEDENYSSNIFDEMPEFSDEYDTEEFDDLDDTEDFDDEMDEEEFDDDDIESEDFNDYDLEEFDDDDYDEEEFDDYDDEGSDDLEREFDDYDDEGSDDLEREFSGAYDFDDDEEEDEDEEDDEDEESEDFDAFDDINYSEGVEYSAKQLKIWDQFYEGGVTDDLPKEGIGLPEEIAKVSPVLIRIFKQFYTHPKTFFQGKAIGKISEKDIVTMNVFFDAIPKKYLGMAKESAIGFGKFLRFATMDSYEEIEDKKLFAELIASIMSFVDNFCFWAGIPLKKGKTVRSFIGKVATSPRLDVEVAKSGLTRLAKVISKRAVKRTVNLLSKNFENIGLYGVKGQVFSVIKAIKSGYITNSAYGYGLGLFSTLDDDILDSEDFNNYGDVINEDFDDVEDYPEHDFDGTYYSLLRRGRAGKRDKKNRQGISIKDLDVIVSLASDLVNPRAIGNIVRFSYVNFPLDTFKDLTELAQKSRFTGISTLYHMFLLYLRSSSIKGRKLLVPFALFFIKKIVDFAANVGMIEPRFSVPLERNIISTLRTMNKELDLTKKISSPLPKKDYMIFAIVPNDSLYNILKSKGLTFVLNTQISKGKVIESSGDRKWVEDVKSSLEELKENARVSGAGGAGAGAQATSNAGSPSLGSVVLNPRDIGKLESIAVDLSVQQNAGRLTKVTYELYPLDALRLLTQSASKTIKGIVPLYEFFLLYLSYEGNRVLNVVLPFAVAYLKKIIDFSISQGIISNELSIEKKIAPVVLINTMSDEISKATTFGKRLPNTKYSKLTLTRNFIGTVKKAGIMKYFETKILKAKIFSSRFDIMFVGIIRSAVNKYEESKLLQDTGAQDAGAQLLGGELPSRRKKLDRGGSFQPDGAGYEEVAPRKGRKLTSGGSFQPDGYGAPQGKIGGISVQNVIDWLMVAPTVKQFLVADKSLIPYDELKSIANREYNKLSGDRYGVFIPLYEAFLTFCSTNNKKVLSALLEQIRLFAVAIHPEAGVRKDGKRIIDGSQKAANNALKSIGNNLGKPYKNALSYSIDSKYAGKVPTSDGDWVTQAKLGKGGKGGSSRGGSTTINLGLSSGVTSAITDYIGKTQKNMGLWLNTSIKRIPFEELKELMTAYRDATNNGLNPFIAKSGVNIDTYIYNDYEYFITYHTVPNENAKARADLILKIWRFFGCILLVLNNGETQAGFKNEADRKSFVKRYRDLLESVAERTGRRAIQEDMVLSAVAEKSLRFDQTRSGIVDESKSGKKVLVNSYKNFSIMFSYLSGNYMQRARRRAMGVNFSSDVKIGTNYDYLNKFLD